MLLTLFLLFRTVGKPCPLRQMTTAVSLWMAMSFVGSATLLEPRPELRMDHLPDHRSIPLRGPPTLRPVNASTLPAFQTPPLCLKCPDPGPGHGLEVLRLRPGAQAQPWAPTLASSAGITYHPEVPNPRVTYSAAAFTAAPMPLAGLSSLCNVLAEGRSPPPGAWLQQPGHPLRSVLLGCGHS